PHGPHGWVRRRIHDDGRSATPDGEYRDERESRECRADGIGHVGGVRSWGAANRDCRRRRYPAEFDIVSAGIRRRRATSFELPAGGPPAGDVPAADRDPAGPWDRAWLHHI